MNRTEHKRLMDQACRPVEPAAANGQWWVYPLVGLMEVFRAICRALRWAAERRQWVKDEIVKERRKKMNQDMILHREDWEVVELKDLPQTDVARASVVIVHGDGGFGGRVLKNRNGPLQTFTCHWTELDFRRPDSKANECETGN